MVDRGSPGVPLLLFRVDDGTKGGAEGERVGCGVVGVKGFALGENTGVCVADAAAAVAAAFCGEVLRCFSFLRRLSLACLISCKLHSSWRRVVVFLLLFVLLFSLVSVENVGVLVVGVSSIGSESEIGANAGESGERETACRCFSLRLKRLSLSKWSGIKSAVLLLFRCDISRLLSLSLSNTAAIASAAIGMSVVSVFVAPAP